MAVPMGPLPLAPGAPASPASRVRGVAVVSALLEVFEEPAATYELFHLRVLVGAEQTSPAHPPGVTEHITVFQGLLRAGPVGAPMTAGPGEHISWTADVPHTYAAAGDAEVYATLLIRTPKARRQPRRLRG